MAGIHATMPPTELARGHTDVREDNGHELFPTPVWVVDLRPDVHGPLNLKIIAAVDALAASRPLIKPGETWQTDPYTRELPQFTEVAAVIRAGAKGALDFLQVEYDAFEMTGCWVNINPKGGSIRAIRTPTISSPASTMCRCPTAPTASSSTTRGRRP